MKRVWRAFHVVEAMHVRNVLESAGLPAILRNENLIRVAGEVPFDQAWPEVWILNDTHAAPAAALIHELRHPPYAPAWTCQQCQETLEGQFTTCWNCGSDRPG